MKRKSILWISLLAVLAFGGCKYDDDALWEELNTTKDRVVQLEKQVESLNGDINALRTLTAAIEQKDCITQVSELADGSGYTIKFQNADPIVICHGTRGADGNDGNDAAPAPMIGVTAVEGVYYWTLGSEPIRTAGG